jgi:hypothetical protein
MKEKARRQRETERDRGLERQSYRETERQRDRERQRETERDRGTERQSYRETERQRDRETETVSQILFLFNRRRIQMSERKRMGVLPSGKN